MEGKGLTDEQSNNEGPNGQTGWPDSNRNTPSCKHGHWTLDVSDKCQAGYGLKDLTEHGAVPPLGDLAILAHQPSMDVGLLVHGPTTLYPNLLAEVEEGVCDSRSDGREA